LRMALREVVTLSERLSVPDGVTDEAVHTCTRSLERGLVKGRAPGQAAASSPYAACREKEVPVTPDDVAAASGVRRDDIARCCRLMVRELNLKMPIADPAEYVGMVASKAGVDTRAQADAREILSKSPKSRSHCWRLPGWTRGFGPIHRVDARGQEIDGGGRRRRGRRSGVHRPKGDQAPQEGSRDLVEGNAAEEGRSGS